MEPNRKLDKDFVSFIACFFLGFFMFYNLKKKIILTFLCILCSIQIQSYISSGVGSIEYDPTILYKATNEFAYPSPLPLAVAIIDKAALVFALAFPYVAQKHRVQMLNYFQECIKHAKSSRQVAIQINIITAILGALKVCISLIFSNCLTEWDCFFLIFCRRWRKAK